MFFYLNASLNFWYDCINIILATKYIEYYFVAFLLFVFLIDRIIQRRKIEYLQTFVGMLGIDDYCHSKEVRKYLEKFNSISISSGTQLALCNKLQLEIGKRINSKYWQHLQLIQELLQGIKNNVDQQKAVLEKLKNDQHQIVELKNTIDSAIKDTQNSKRVIQPGNDEKPKVTDKPEVVSLPVVNYKEQESFTSSFAEKLLKRINGEVNLQEIVDYLPEEKREEFKTTTNQKALRMDLACYLEGIIKKSQPPR